MIFYVLLAILLFGLLIAVHEGGHFVSAKLLGVQVNEFSIGMGPLIYSKKKGETEYSLRAIPMGGYCAMEGEDEETGSPRAFSSKPAWRRLIILAAGSFMNFVAGLLILVVIFATSGSFTVPVIGDFMEGFPLQSEEGLMVGDRILSIDGKKVSVYADVSTYLMAAGGENVDLVIRRDGKNIHLNDFPLKPQEYVLDGEKQMKYGLYFASEEANPLTVLRQSWDTSWYFARSVWSGLGMLIRGDAGLNDFAGPVGIVSIIGEAGTQSQDVIAGVQNVFYIIALIAVNLAIVNLLPIPALDGGRIFFLLLGEIWWLVSKKKIDPKYEGYVHMIGFALLIALMLVITFNDVVRLVK